MSRFPRSARCSTSRPRSTRRGVCRTDRTDWPQATSRCTSRSARSRRGASEQPLNRCRRIPSLCRSAMPHTSIPVRRLRSSTTCAGPRSPRRATTRRRAATACASTCGYSRNSRTRSTPRGHRRCRNPHRVVVQGDRLVEHDDPTRIHRLPALQEVLNHGVPVRVPRRDYCAS